ncbi:MAG: PIN domain-containing protein [Candidatus Kapaibacterium sp.]
MGDNPDLLDSNIWIYSFSSNFDERKRATAIKLIENCDIRISTQIIGEVCNAALRKAHASEFRIKELIDSFFDRFDPIEIQSRSQMIRASSLRERYNFSYWDSFIVLAALESNCSILYSEDMQDGLVVDGTLTIRNPFKEP